VAPVLVSQAAQETQKTKPMLGSAVDAVVRAKRLEQLRAAREAARRRITDAVAATTGQQSMAMPQPKSVPQSVRVQPLQLGSNASGQQSVDALPIAVPSSLSTVEDSWPDPMAAATEVKSRRSSNLQDKVQVCVRVRPVVPGIDNEDDRRLWIDEAQQAVQIPPVPSCHVLNGGSTVNNGGRRAAAEAATSKAYRFSRVFGPERSTEWVYDEAFRANIAEMLNGYNVTIFAYGQTGSGKTHTMTGCGVQQPGICSLAFAQIFESCGTCLLFFFSHGTYLLFVVC